MAVRRQIDGSKEATCRLEADTGLALNSRTLFLSFIIGNRTKNYKSFCYHHVA